MRLLLTGASGFIGKNFLELAPKSTEIFGIYSKSKGIENFVKEKKLRNVKLYKCDLTIKDEVEKLFAKIGKNFESCIYLAGNVNVPVSITNPAEDLNANAVGIINFFQCCERIGKFIYMSSAAVYDGNKGRVTAKTRLDPIIPYCISKLATEQYIKFYSYSEKIKSYAILRLGGAYGRYSEKKFVSKLVEDVLQDKKVIEVYGDGTNIVNVMYVKDVIKALFVCLKSKKSNVVCNLGQENMTITELVQRTAKVFNKKISIKYTPRRKDQKYITFSIEVDFNKLFDFKPDYSFEEGIKEFGRTKNDK
ncbi:MAG: NAD(P)-dependent oxidoreductase [Nanoarchaeota archaeon]